MNPHRVVAADCVLGEGPLWSRVEASRVLALHVAGDFPGLRLELWALRA